MLISGCIPDVKVHPQLGVTVAPPSPAMVASCQKERSIHDFTMIGGVVLGGATTGLQSSESFLDNQNTKNDVQIAAISTGVVAAILTAISTIENSNYIGDNCAIILSQTPAVPSK